MQGKSEKGKLAPKAERYCQYRVMGMNPLQAMESAGFKLDPNASMAALTKKANNYDRAPYIQERISEIRTQNTLLEGDTARPIDPNIFAKLELGEQPMTLGWLNSAAFTVYRQAMVADNFHQCLQVLKFIADLNSLGGSLPKPGRPSHDRTPNDNQTSHNNEFDPNVGASEEDEDVDSLFARTDGGDGESAPHSRTAARKIQTSSDEGSGETEDPDDGSDESDSWDAGFDGED